MKSLTQTFLDELNQNIGIVHRVCNVYGSADSLDREDLFQEIMYQLWRSFPSFTGGSKFSTWMYRVSLNTAITGIRNKRKSPTNQPLTEQNEQMADTTNAGEKEEQARMLYAAIYTLSAIDKAIILLFLEEHSYEEIASITGLTRTHVSVRLVRIKKSLEGKLKSKI